MNQQISKEAFLTEITAHLQTEVDHYIEGTCPLIDKDNPEAPFLLARYNPDIPILLSICRAR